MTNGSTANTISKSKCQQLPVNTKHTKLFRAIQHVRTQIEGWDQYVRNRPFRVKQTDPFRFLIKPDPFGFCEIIHCKMAKSTPTQSMNCSKKQQQQHETKTTQKQNSHRKQPQVHRRGDNETTTMKSADLNRSERNQRSEALHGEDERSQNQNRSTWFSDLPATEKSASHH